MSNRSIEEKLDHSVCNFGDGVKISKKEINEWHERVLEQLKNGAKYSSIASGNSMVIGSSSNEPDCPIVIYEITNGYIKHDYF